MAITLLFITNVAVVIGLSGTDAQRCLSSSRFKATSMQWVAMLNYNETTPTIWDARNTIDYDTDMRMMKQQTSRLDVMSGTLTNYTVVQNYNTSKMYVTESGHCHIEDYVGPFFGRCMPAMLKLSSSYTVAGGRVTVNVFSGDIMGNRYHIHITDTGETFAVVSYSLKSLGMYRMETQLFGNVEMGVVRDPNIFRHDHCHESMETIG